MLETREKNIATFIHLSTLLKFIIPFGNYIGPLLLWISNKDKSDFIDAHGKQALNFQISMLLYAIIFGVLTLPFLIFGILGQISFLNFNGFENIQFALGPPFLLLIFIGIILIIMVIAFFFELICVIIASIKARDGLLYKYPLTINFFK